MAYAVVASVTAQLRRAGLHARFTYKTTRNMGKLMKDAANAKARFTVILDDGAAAGMASLKDMNTGEQRETPINDLLDLVSNQ